MSDRADQRWVPLMVGPPEVWRLLASRDRGLASLLELLVHEAHRSFPQTHSLTLFGGITLGEFSPGFSDINVAMFSREPLLSEDSARALRLWSLLVREHGDLARRLVVNIIPVPGIGPRHAEAPLGFQIRSRLEDGRAMCEALWRWPFHPVDEHSLVRHGWMLLGHAPRRFLRTGPLRDALTSSGRREIERLFVGRDGRRLLTRTFRRAGRPGVGRSMTRVEEARYVAAVLGMTRLVHSLAEDRLVARSESGFWFRSRFGGVAGRFAQDIASYRLKPDAFPTDFLSDRARFFPQLARVVLEETAPALYNRAVRVEPASAGGSPFVEWDDLTAVAGRLVG